MIKIKHSNYDEGIHDLNIEAKPESLEIDDTFVDVLKLKIRMDKSHSQIVLDCNLNATAKLGCDRCGEEFTRNYESDFQLIYMFGPENTNDDSLNVYYLTPETDTINITEDVKDYALLSVPMKRLCDEDCKGLCPSCGKNLNEGDCGCQKDEINPMWLPLQELKKKFNN